MNRRIPTVLAVLGALAVLAGCGQAVPAAAPIQTHIATSHPVSSETASSFSAPAAGSTDGTDAAELPLAVQPVLQNPELPNGCEAASLAMLLQYQGFSVSAAELARDWLPRTDFTYSGQDRYGPDPEKAYAGDPFSAKGGWYCFEAPVIEAANGYLLSQGSALTACSFTGAEAGDLLEFLQAGWPVAVWFTQDQEPPRYNLRFSWTLPSGETYQPYANLHCVVLVGMDEMCCTLADPLHGIVQVDRATFDEIYAAMGCRAVVLV